MKLFQLLAQETQDGIKGLDGELTSVDVALDKILSDTRFAILLAPLQGVGRGGAPTAIRHGGFAV